MCLHQKDHVGRQENRGKTPKKRKFLGNRFTNNQRLTISDGLSDSTNENDVSDSESNSKVKFADPSATKGRHTHSRNFAEIHHIRLLFGS